MTETPYCGTEMIRTDNITTDDYDWRDCEYDEEKDCYCVKECWYEVNVVDDNPNWIIDSDYDVTHWMPLPPFPTEKEE